MKRIIPIVCIFLGSIASISFAQNLKPEIVGNKEIVTKERAISSFKHLKVIGLEIELEKSQSPTLKITAESNIVDHVVSELRGDTLLFYTKRDQPLREITVPKLHVGYQEVQSILASNASVKLLTPLKSEALLVKLQIKSSLVGELNVKNLNMSLTTSQATLSGKSNSCQIDMFVLSKLIAEEFYTDIAEVREETQCESYLNVGTSLTPRLFGESKIENKGSAKENILYPPMEQMLSWERMKNRMNRKSDLMYFE